MKFDIFRKFRYEAQNFWAETLGGNLGRKPWAETLGGNLGRKPWAETLGGNLGRKPWAETLGGNLGRKPWAETLGGNLGRKPWAETLGGNLGRKPWAETLGGNLWAKQTGHKSLFLMGLFLGIFVLLSLRVSLEARGNSSETTDDTVLIGKAEADIFNETGYPIVKKPITLKGFLRPGMAT